MGNIFKKISPAVFGLTLICFILPFVTVSCQGQKIASFTGVQLMTGTTIKEPGSFGQQKTKKVDSEPTVLIAFLAGVAGLGISFLKSKKSAIVPAGFGLIGLIMLLVMKYRLDNQILSEGGGMLQIDYDIGYWLTFLLYLLAIGFNGFIFFEGGNGKKEEDK